METFSLVVDKRSLRTLFYQDLFRDEGSCPECGDMTLGQRPAAAWPTANSPIRATQHAAKHRGTSGTIHGVPVLRSLAGVPDRMPSDGGIVSDPPFPRSLSRPRALRPGD